MRKNTYFTSLFFIQIFILSFETKQLSINQKSITSINETSFLNKNNIETNNIETNVSSTNKNTNNITLTESSKNINDSKENDNNDIKTFDKMKNLLTFSEITRKFNNVQSFSTEFIQKIYSKVHSQYDIELLALITIIIIILIIVLVYMNYKENENFNTYLSKKLKTKKKGQENIFLKGRTLHKPINKYFIVEKNIIPDETEKSENSLLENEDNILPNSINKIDFSNDFKFGSIFNNETISKSEKYVSHTLKHEKLKHCSEFDPQWILINEKIREEKNEDIDKLLNDLNNDLPINKNSEKIELDNKEFNTNNNLEKQLNRNIKDSKAEKISYLLQNHICEETVITKCSIPADFKFKNALKN